MTWGCVQGRAMSAAERAKRKIGGHFGSAVGSSTKRQRGSWRDELDDPSEGTVAGAVASESAPSAPLPALVGGDDSSSEVPMDPGTPLPSESEEEQAAAAGLSGNSEEAVAGVTVADGVGATGSADTSGQIPGAAASQAEVAATGIATAEPSAATTSGKPPVAVTLELMMGDTVGATLKVLLKGGLDQAIEQRLAACAPPDGSTIEAIAAGAHCTFAGHPSGVPVVKRRQSDGKVGDGEDLDGNSDGSKAEVAAGDGEDIESNAGAIKEGAAAGSSSGSAGAEHCRAGLLSAPREGSGLLLTLGPQPKLDATHSVLGHLLLGKRAVRLLEALAPLSGGFGPRLPLTMRIVGPSTQSGGPGVVQVSSSSAENGSAAGTAADATGNGKEEDEKADAPLSNGSSKGAHAVIEHGFLLVEPVSAEGHSQPFSLEAVSRASVAEELEIAELAINGRDAEIAEMKGMPFNRERAEGVAAVEGALKNLKSRFDEFSDLEQALSHQSHWLQERVSHLLRILQKLK